MKEPQLQLRRKKKDALPLLYLFGVEIREDALEAEAFHVTQPIRAGTLITSGGKRYRLPLLPAGFQVAALRVPHA